MNFALIGAAGYVAPRHMEAIKTTGNKLIAALDPHDSVGILDTYFPNCEFFTSQESFDRYILNMDKDDRPEFMSICSPNYLHESHSKFAMRLGSNVICEKPLLLCDYNINQLEEVEAMTGKKVYTILQLRHHPSFINLKNKINSNEQYKVSLKYITPRGPWYHHSWKGDERKSGGIETNIGIHFFDLLLWLFGDLEKVKIYERNSLNSIGTLYFNNVEVNWHLSIDRNELPYPGLKFYRSMTINKEEIRFDDIITKFHILSYKEILKGNGFTTKDVYPAIKLVTDIREGKWG